MVVLASKQRSSSWKMVVSARVYHWRLDVSINARFSRAGKMQSTLITSYYPGYIVHVILSVRNKSPTCCTYASMTKFTDRRLDSVFDTFPPFREFLHPINCRLLDVVCNVHHNYIGSISVWIFFCCKIFSQKNCTTKRCSTMVHSCKGAAILHLLFLCFANAACAHIDQLNT